MTEIPLIRHSESVFAYCKGLPVSVSRYLSDVENLLQVLPDKRHILNLCTDRYHFAVGFGAALLCNQISLLPPNYTQRFVELLCCSYPDLYCLADDGSEFQGVEVVRYPQLPETEDTRRTIPSIPVDRLAALVFTSGSTGEPVAHPKTWGSLCGGALAAAARLGIKQDSGLAVLGTVPAQHMYGLESCLLMAMQNGLALVAEKPYYPADICAQLAALPVPRCLVTTPLHLHYLRSEIPLLSAVEFVLCSTADLAPSLAIEAEVRFAAPLYEIYGCTEAGMVASRRTVEGAAWHLLPDVELRQDEQGSYVLGGHIEIEALLGDEIESRADNQFVLQGRTADMINIAGKRTSLASLNFYLNEIPGVQDGVFFLPEESRGVMSRLRAFVVAPELQSREILSALQSSMDALFLPRPLYFVDKLPRNATGKLTREALHQLMALCEKK